MTQNQKTTTYVKKPALINGVWTVVVADSPSPLANVIESVPCGSREGAYQAYRRIMKELGRGY